MASLLTEEQQQIAEQARRVAAAGYAGDRLRALLETVGRFDAAFWQTARDQGWTALGVPEARGGLGLGLAEQGLVAEACGRFAGGVPFLSAGYVAAKAIAAYGDDEIQRAWLPRLANGTAIVAVALDPSASVPARLEAGLLAGGLQAVTGAAVADGLLALVATPGGPALALASLDHAGAERLPRATFDNSRCIADLSLNGVPAVMLRGGQAAVEAADDLLGRLAVLVAHEQVGGAERLLEAARDFALERRAFGQPIGAFQSVKHRIAELYVEVELARAAARGAASLEGRPGFARGAAAARLLATTAYETAARDCIQVHGGIGVTWESDLHLHQRRARMLALETGSRLVWEDRLAGLIAGPSQ